MSIFNPQAQKQVKIIEGKKAKENILGSECCNIGIDAHIYAQVVLLGTLRIVQLYLLLLLRELGKMEEIISYVVVIVVNYLLCIVPICDYYEKI